MFKWLLEALGLSEPMSECTLCGEKKKSKKSYCTTCANALNSANYHVKKQDINLSKEIPLQTKIICYAYGGKRIRELRKRYEGKIFNT